MISVGSNNISLLDNGLCSKVRAQLSSHQSAHILLGSFCLSVYHCTTQNKKILNNKKSLETSCIGLWRKACFNLARKRGVVIKSKV